MHSGSSTIHARIAAGPDRRGQAILTYVLATGAAILQLALATYSAYAGPLPAGVSDIDVTNDTTRRWGEPQIAINPQNPNNMVYTIVGLANTSWCIAEAKIDPDSPCASRGNRGIGLSENVPGFVVIGVWATFDGGKTWKRSANVPGEVSIFPPDHKASKARASSGDPMVTVGPDGAFYLGWDAIHFATSGPVTDYGGIAVSKSTDGGLTWTQPVLTGTTIDRPMITADLAKGDIYESSSGQALGPLASGDPTTPATNPGTRYVVTSKDGVSWSKPQPVGGNGSLAAAHGILTAVFKTAGEAGPFGGANNELCGSAPTPCTIFQTSTDAGATWSRQAMQVPNTNSGRPAVAADPSRPGHFTVALLVDNDAAFDFYQTRDGGKTWSGPTKVTDDPGKSHYQMSMAYGPKGDLAVMWKTRDAPPTPPPAAPAAPGGGNAGPFPAYNVFAVTSKDGGASFSRPLKLNAMESPARPTQSAGDDLTFVAVTADQAYFAYASWASPERAGFLSTVKLSAFKH